MLENNYYDNSLTLPSVIWTWVAVVLVVLIVVWLAVQILRRYLRKYNIVPSEWQPVVLALTVPKIIKKDNPDGSIQYTQEAISLAENLFANLGGLRAQRGLKAWFYGRTDIFSLEVVAHKGLVEFYVAVPRVNREFLEQQLNSIYPHIDVVEIEDYNIFRPESNVAAAMLSFKRDFIFPIKTYKKLENDPLEAITTSLSKVNEDEGALVQLVVRSAPARWHYAGTKVASEMEQGKRLSEALQSVGFGSRFSKFMKFSSELVKASGVSNRPPEQLQPKAYQLSPMEQEMVKGIEEKSAKAGLDANLRVVVAAKSRSLANNRLQDILNSFSQFNIYQYGNSFKVHQPKKEKKLERIVHDSIYRNFDEKYKLIINTEESVSLWHLPLPTNHTPNIKWLGARKAPPPINLPGEGILLGLSDYRGIKREVRMKRADRRRHVYVIGQTGTGKTTLMKDMMIDDMKAGEGCCVIDPHGDFALDMLANVPKERAEDVVYFNPTDIDYPISINMLEFETPEQKTFVVNEMLSIFDKLYDLRATGGPVFEQYMRNALLLIMEDPASGMTLMEVPKVLADEKFRRYKLSKCLNPSVKDFWEKEAQKAGGEAALANVVPYITSKLTPFIANDIMRPIIAQQHSTVNFRKIMDEGKILIVNLTKGKLGDINSSLLGMIIVGKILLASLARVDMAEEDRKDFYLYIDEFQNFTTDSIAIILSEARKYKLNLTIAHQYIGQLVKNNNTAIRDAVFGNAGTTVAYRVGVEDAETFAKQFAPVFDEFDVVNIPKYTAYIKLLVDNANPPAFNINPLKPPVGSQEMANALIELSRLKYGRPRVEVEAEILKRSQANFSMPVDSEAL